MAPDEDDEQVTRPIAYIHCPDSNHPHAIDLELPSGTMWACCNVDADKPEDSGGYYAWGETNEKGFYSWENYQHCDGSATSCHDIGTNICGTQYDVAHVKWGGSWSMPNEDQINELKGYCQFELTTFNGIAGIRYTSKKNGGSIFLPASGYRYQYHVCLKVMYAVVGRALRIQSAYLTP